MTPALTILAMVGFNLVPLCPPCKSIPTFLVACKFIVAFVVIVLVEFTSSITKALLLFLLHLLFV